MSTLGSYHDYTGGSKMHVGVIMSTPGDFGMNGKRPRPNFQNFVQAPFATMVYAVVYVGLWNIRLWSAINDKIQIVQFCC